MIAKCRIFLLLVFCPLSAWANDQSFSAIERGRYLALLGDCVACHTAQYGIPFAGGRLIGTPFGVLATPNITPDSGTGIGSWTDAQFVRAMQQGIAADGAHLYPAFPYTAFTKMSRQDILDIRAFLNTLDPVVNAVQTDLLPFPFDIRENMIAWNALFFRDGRFQPNPAKSAEWNRGAYIVEGPAHCGACHTAKNLLGGDSAATLQGGVLQGWLAPALTNDPRTGLGAWSIDDVVEYLKTGRNSRSAASGPMAEAIIYSLAKLDDADLRAIAVYLKDHPGSDTGAPSPILPDDPVMKAGQAIYLDNCAACHTSGGVGIARMFPSLKGDAVVQSDDPTTVLRVVLVGADAAATDAAPTGPKMPPFGWKLSDDEIASVTTYIRNAWGNAASATSGSAVRSARAALTP
jgi:mono/diheme cytochrome c family protein